jgi:hypothetical protein
MIKRQRRRKDMDGRRYLALVLAKAFLYIVSPVDIIPDPIPVAGLTMQQWQWERAQLALSLRVNEISEERRKQLERKHIV